MSESNANEGAEDPLEDVFIDESAIDRERVASILNGYANVGEESGRLVPTPSYEELTANEKILVTLVAERAKELKDATESASLGPSKISEISGVAEGTVKRGVRELADDGLIYDDDKGYSVQPPELRHIEDFLDTDE